MGFFDGLLDGITGSIGSIITGGISAGADVFGGERANAASAKSADKQMDFQRDMRSSAYQTAVEDMKKAGLNPAMMYNSGAGPAPTPVGAKYEAKNTTADLGKSVSSGVALRQVGLNENMTKSQINLNEANTANALKQAENIAADTELKKANAAYVSGPQSNTTDAQGALNTANFENVKQATVNAKKQLEILKENLTSAQQKNRVGAAEAALADFSLEVSKDHPDISYMQELIARLSGMGDDIVSTINPLKGILKGFRKEKPLGPITTESNSETYHPNGSVTGRSSYTTRSR